MIDRSPLCPLSPPPSFSRSVAVGRSSSSWTTTIWSGGDLVEVAQRGHRPAGLVHVRRRLGQRPTRRRPVRTAGRLDDRRRRARWALNAAPEPVGQQVDDHEARRCAGCRVAGPGVAEPDDQPAGLRSRSPQRSLVGRMRGRRHALSASARPRQPRRRLLGGLGALGGLAGLLLDAASAWAARTCTTTVPRGRRSASVPCGSVMSLAWIDGAGLAGPRCRRRSARGCGWPRPRPVSACEHVLEQAAAGGRLALECDGTSTVTFSPR